MGDLDGKRPVKIFTKILVSIYHYNEMLSRIKSRNVVLSRSAALAAVLQSSLLTFPTTAEKKGYSEDGLKIDLSV